MNENEHWIPSSEAAVYLNVTERAVQILIEREAAPFEFKYIPGKGKGGKQLRILLESLPQEAQDRYNGLKRKLELPCGLFQSASEKQKQSAELKQEAVLEYREYKRTVHKQGKTKEFVQMFREKYPDMKITVDSLEEWTNKYIEYGIDGLVDRRGKHIRQTSAFTEEMKNVFKKYYLTDRKPSIHQCYLATKDFFLAKGIDIPGEGSFKQYVYKGIPLETKALYREGQKYFDDNFMPSMFTDYNSPDLHSNSMWVADHHKCDVLVNYKGEIIRPWLTAFTDFKSRYIVGYIIFPHEPNADIILDCLAVSIRDHGVPDKFLTDNGKDYKVHDLFDTDNEYSIVSILKSAVRTALPYNAKAKPIERNFRTIESLCKMCPSYIGDRPENRPTTMKGTNKAIQREEKAMDFEEFVKFMDDNINIYHNTPHSGNGNDGKTPLMSYKAGFSAEHAAKMLDVETLSYIMRRTTRLVTITKQGIRFAELPNVGYYISTELLMYGIGKKVYARYSTDDVTHIYVYSEDGRYICTASNSNLYVYGAGREIQKQKIRENANLKKAQLKKAREAYPHNTEVPTIMEVCARRSAAFGAPDFSDIPRINYNEVLGIHSENVINTSDPHGDDCDFNYGEENEYFTRLANFG